MNTISDIIFCTAVSSPYSAVNLNDSNGGAILLGIESAPLSEDEDEDNKKPQKLTHKLNKQQKQRWRHVANSYELFV